MSHSLNSIKGVFIRGHEGHYYRGYELRRILGLGVESLDNGSHGLV